MEDSSATSRVSLCASFVVTSLHFSHAIHHLAATWHGSECIDEVCKLGLYGADILGIDFAREKRMGLGRDYGGVSFSFFFGGGRDQKGGARGGGCRAEKSDEVVV